MHQTPEPKPVQLNSVIRLIRIFGGALMAVGALLFFNVGDTSALLGLEDATISKYAGALFMLVGLTDIILVPLILERKKSRK